MCVYPRSRKVSSDSVFFDLIKNIFLLGAYCVSEHSRKNCGIPCLWRHGKNTAVKIRSTGFLFRLVQLIAEYFWAGHLSKLSKNGNKIYIVSPMD